MNNIDKGSIKYLVIIIIVYILMGLILYPVLDILYCKLITRRDFIYSVSDDVIKPIIFCSVMAVCSWIIGKK